MAILLDSHAFAWWALEDSKLSQQASSAIRDDPDVLVSAVVAWEISSKVRSGKWPEAKVLSDRFFETVQHYRWKRLPITLEHAHRAGSMPGGHRDPFDRMLAAQAMVEGVKLVTADRAFRHFGVQVIW